MKNLSRVLLLIFILTEIGSLVSIPVYGHDRAIEELLVQANKGNADAQYNMGLFLAKQGRAADAITHYSEALRIHPNYMDALNNLAWIFATNGDPAFRNGVKAVQMAERACKISGNNDPFLLDTLAAAYAETGRFEKAGVTAQKAFDLARSSGFEPLAGAVEKRLQLYRSNRPFYEDR